jgi:hypothetical protein
MKKTFCAISAILLLLEIALVVSLRTQGWYETGDWLRWTASLLAALIPLVIAAILLIKGGLRFSLRSLLVAVGLVAAFLYASVLPVLEASRARSGSRRLLATGATLLTEFDREKFYERLGFDPRDSRMAPVAALRELPPWLMPLAGEVVDIPPDRAIRNIELSSDLQVSELCQSTAKFPDLERITISTGVTPNGIELLRDALPKFEHLTELQFSGDQFPRSIVDSPANIRSLWIWAGRPPRGRPTREDLAAIAKLPQLKLLFIFGHPITDADVTALDGSTSLRHVFFRGTTVTEAGKQQLEAALPECEVHW